MSSEQLVPPSSVVDATRPNPSVNRRHICRSDSSTRAFDSPSSPRRRSHHHPVFEPPIPPDDRPSSPRHHSTSSPSSSRRRSINASRPSSSTASGAATATGAATSRASRRATPRRSYDTPPPISTTSVWVEDEEFTSLPSLHDRNNNDDTLAALTGWSPSALGHFYSSDDQFISDLANNAFSSPSTYPSFTNPSPADRPLDSQATNPGAFSAPRTRNTGNPSQSTTQLSASTSFNSDHSIFTESRAAASFQYSPQSSCGSDIMPPVTRRRSGSNTAVEFGAPYNAPLGQVGSNKRRRTAAAATDASKKKSGHTHKKIKLDQDDPFKDSDSSSPAKADGDEPYMIDLTEGNGLPEELKSTPADEPPKEDDRTKLAAFQCVICMDDVSTLTVTHCGHMFCAGCLHASLNVETTKGRCPMCRQKLDIKPREEYNTRTKGWYPLELKLMTSTRKGKRKAGSPP